MRVIGSTNAQVITSFSLYQAPNKLLGPVPDSINVAVLGRDLTIVANTDTTSTVGKIVFKFDGATVRSESVSPYALGGDTNGIFKDYPNLLKIGSHTVNADLFLVNGKKTSSKSVTFVVVDNPISAPVPIRTPIRAPVSIPTPIKAPVAAGNFRITGELRKWHKVTLAFDGPSVSENDAVNPFMNYRLDVLFSHTLTKKSYNVPGYFAADGNAAETSASSGNQWHCHFAPDEIGEWTFKASFTTGVDVATSTVPGIPTAFHGLTGVLNIANTNKSGRDLRGKGRLMHVGQHHLQFAETKEWFLKVGPDRCVIGQPYAVSIGLPVEWLVQLHNRTTYLS